MHRFTEVFLSPFMNNRYMENESQKIKNRCPTNITTSAKYRYSNFFETLNCFKNSYLISVRATLNFISYTNVRTHVCKLDVFYR